MGEIDPLIQTLLNNYEQLAAAVELFLESPQQGSSAYLDMLKKSLSDLQQVKYNIASSIVSENRHTF